jgi:pyridoxal phosphate enzyme (YggS family)
MKEPVKYNVSSSAGPSSKDDVSLLSTIFMAINIEKYKQLAKELGDEHISLVAVSKTKPVEDIISLYELGHRDFGENYVQELLDKASRLPKDIRWHFIGHLQTNKVKSIVPIVQLIHGVDSLKLLKELEKQASKSGKIIECLLQVFIASEETKFGLDEKELDEIMNYAPDNKFVRIRGLMGMASFTEEQEIIIKEFSGLKRLYDQYWPNGDGILSMGMSSDYQLAISQGSTMVRIGSILFGERTPATD